MENKSTFPFVVFGHENLYSMYLLNKKANDTENMCIEYNLFYNCLVNKLLNTWTKISQANYIQSNSMF